MSKATAGKDRHQVLWRDRLGSALRTALACSIVGCTTLYGPAPIRRLLTYPAFSYVTTILIVSDATLGDTLRGCWHALYATLQVVPLSMFSLWVIGPARFTNGLAAAAVALCTFVVALPESTHLMSKRIAFGQLVIVYVGTIIHGANTGVVMHPIHVASSTGLGALASVLAMLFPYPRLAYYEVRKTCRLYAENASERLNIFVKAFTVEDNPAAFDLISQAESLSKTGAKLLQSIKDYQEAMLWERPQIRCLRPSCMDPGAKFQDMELPIRGMKIALTSCPSFPVGLVDQELRDALASMQLRVGLKLEQAKCFAPSDATTAPETKGEFLDKSLWTPKTISTSHEALLVFFLFCMELLQGDPPIARNLEYVGENTEKPNTAVASDSQNQAKCRLKRMWSSLIIRPNSERLIFAFKCSLSLGLAVLFGLIYNKENGHWAGLTIAISFVTARQATFTVANARAQGTAMGSIYGVLCCFVFLRSMHLRFLSLQPWIIFTSFLRHSRMYGQAGGTSAVIGALLILGRKNYGAPSEFAIARITEASIGLICFITIEILFHPARAATLAKLELSHSLGTLRECIEDIVLCVSQKNMPASSFSQFREKQKKLNSHVRELEKFTAEAEKEPNFWFMPFQGSCYHKLLRSLSTTADLLLIMAYKMEILSQASQKFGIAWKELHEHMNGNIVHFAERVGSSLRCLEEATFIKSITKLELQKKSIHCDVELGKPPNTNVIGVLGTDEEEIAEILSSFLQQSKEVADKIHAHEVEEELKRQMIHCLSGLSVCISSLMKETVAIEKEVKEIIRNENP